MVLMNPIVLRIGIELGYSIDTIALIIGMWGAITLVSFILIEKHWGTFGKADLQMARDKAQSIQNETTKNIVMVDNRETNDIIEAKKKKETIEQLKQEKYGNPNYDYGKAEAEKIANAERIKALQDELAKLVPQPTPTPTTNPIITK